MSVELFLKREVDRLLNVTIALGWELKEEKQDSTGVTVVLRRDPAAAVLKAAGGFGFKPLE